MHLIKTKYITLGATQPHRGLAEVSIKLYNAEVFAVEFITSLISKDLIFFSRHCHAYA